MKFIYSWKCEHFNLISHHFCHSIAWLWYTDGWKIKAKRTYLNILMCLLKPQEQLMYFCTDSPSLLNCDWGMNNFVWTGFGLWWWRSLFHIGPMSCIGRSPDLVTKDIVCDLYNGMVIEMFHHRIKWFRWTQVQTVSWL